MGILEKYYRFRSAERLLGKPACGDDAARPGELDELTIYFASPHELNDPLEGHRETFFHGDLIVWRNLIKHYTLLLYASVVDVYADAGDGLIKYPNLRPESFQGISRDTVENAISSVLGNKEISLYIKALAETGRKIPRKELISHLHILHTAIVTFILNELSKNFELPDAARYNSALPNFLLFIEMRAGKIYSEGLTPNLEEYTEIEDKIRQQALRASALRSDELSAGLLLIFINFPRHFAEQIDYLVFPHWYVACFMKSCANSSIWGSYGDNHKGICLIYKARSDNGVDSLKFQGLPFEFVKSMNRGRPQNEWYLNMALDLPLMEVKYRSEFAAINFFTSPHNEQPEWVDSYWYRDQAGSVSSCAAWMSNVSDDVYVRHQYLFHKSHTTKTAHWQNETEWRVVIAGLPWSREQRQIKYAFNQLEGLIFGINTPDEIKVKVIKKIAEHCAKYRRTDFKFYQAKFNDAYTEIEHELLRYVKFNADGSLNMDPKI
ncbi:DUF2971 domain-containing protein [Pseudomonas pudica]|uniref:DUF2971 domain-containing protein n=1 Tax=Pseudomonas TaxID=286 RepID=UPI0013024121|nr:DUF2971 domain-containing protein [Pseudomonas sp. B10(2017)]